MAEIASQTWFEMPDLRKRRFSTAVWIPLRSAETIFEEGVANRPGWREEVLFAGSVAFAPAKRAEAEKLEWRDIGTSHSAGPYAYRDGSYKPCEVYQYNEGQDLGIDLVFVQHIGNGHQTIWHLSQDLVIALQLLQEGDQWVRPDEDYAIVVRQRRNSEGRIVAIEIRSDCLRDYLAARGLALRLSYYRSRVSVMADSSHLTWAKDGISDEQPHERFEARCSSVDESGGPFGSGIAVFKVWRTDVDPEEDVPIFDREDDSNTDGSTRHFKRRGTEYFRAHGELWRAEWIEPAERSERVRRDKSNERISFIVDAAGERLFSSDLNYEDIGRYLWFDPHLICALMEKRGGGLDWYTRDTGIVWSLPDYKIHFGINRLGLINVYAYDVARLPIWQQRSWAGFNVAPDGAVSSELLDAQMKTQPAHTRAPEQALPELMDALDELFGIWTGGPLFKRHEATSVVIRSIHRFRALDQNGLLALAKDLARLTADRIELNSLKTICCPAKGETWRSLRFLENALATILPPNEARALLTPLVGIYELRLGDAHLPSSAINDAFALTGIDQSKPFADQGFQMLCRAADALWSIGNSLSLALKK